MRHECVTRIGQFSAVVRNVRFSSACIDCSEKKRNITTEYTCQYDNTRELKISRSLTLFDIA